MLFIPYSEVVNKYVHFCALGHKWKSFLEKESHHNKREMQKFKNHHQMDSYWKDG